MPFVEALLIAGSIVTAVPAIVLGVECWVAWPRREPGPLPDSVERPRIAVVVPAHNEEEQIGATLRSIEPELAEGDRLIVVADNCTDGTAAAAAALGAKVLVREDDQRRGKGYAVRFAIDHLRRNPPDVVVNIDADCLARPESIDRIARLAHVAGRPVQAAYLMASPPDADSRSLSRISEFAVLVKNVIRPRGLQRLGLPCLLTGSGMAFPWDALESVPHPESHIVEDMRFTTDLAIAGVAPRPCMEARVVSRLPAQDRAFVTQRTRWEHGHLATIRSEAPRLLGAFLRSGRPSLLALMLELSVPPLSLFVCLLMAAMLVTAAAAALGLGTTPLAIVAASGAFASLGLVAVWWRYGRGVLPIGAVLAIPGYVLKKLPLYGKFVVKPEEGWVRTARDPMAPDASPTGAPHYVDGDPAPAREDATPKR